MAPPTNLSLRSLLVARSAAISLRADQNVAAASFVYISWNPRGNAGVEFATPHALAATAASSSLSFFLELGAGAHTESDSGGLFKKASEGAADISASVERASVGKAAPSAPRVPERHKPVF
jgi:hypothetical protein